MTIEMAVAVATPIAATTVESTTPRMYALLSRALGQYDIDGGTGGQYGFDQSK